jgi:hypothetical protein
MVTSRCTPWWVFIPRIKSWPLKIAGAGFVFLVSCLVLKKVYGFC